MRKVKINLPKKKSHKKQDQGLLIIVLNLLSIAISDAQKIIRPSLSI